jgi:hypothetical protein
MKRVLLLVLSVFPCLQLFGEDARPTPQGLPFKLWYVPPLTFAGPGVKPLSPDVEDQWDLREWFEKNGVKLSPDEEAIYDRSRTTLMVRAKAGTLDLVDSLGFSRCTSYVPCLLRVEVVLVECSAPNLPDLGGEISVDTLRKAAGDSWHVMNRMLVTTKSGQRALMTSMATHLEKELATPPPEKDQSPQSEEDASMKRDEVGASLEVSAILGDKGIICLNLNYHYRAQGTPVWNWEATLSACAHNGAPILLQLDFAAPDAEPARPMKLRAMILRVDVVYPWDKVTIHSLPRRNSPLPSTH